MANQLQVIDLTSGGALALPAHLANLPTIVGTISQGDTRNRIGLKGREFHIFKGGIEEGVLETKHADVVIIGAYPAISRQYYGGIPYEDGVALAPVCYSANGIAPEANSSEPQSDKCQTCPQNVKGSALNGGEKSKACGFLRRIAVLLAGDPEYTIYQLDLKSMSIWDDDKAGTGHNGKFSFTNYAKKLAAHNIDAGMVITRLSFTQDSVPALQFQAIGYINQEQVARIVEMVETGAVKPVLEMNMGANASDVVPPPAQPAQIAPPVATAPAPRVAPQAPVTAARVAPKPPAPAAARPAPAAAARPAAPVARTTAPRVTAPVTVALPQEDDTPDPPTPIRYGQPRSPQAPLATTRPSIRPVAAAASVAAEVQQDVDALLAELEQ